MKLIVSTIKKLLFILFFYMISLGLGSYKPMTIINLGKLIDLYSITGTGEQQYEFCLPQSTVVSIFFNGLSAGYQAELIDDKGTLLAITSNSGTIWPTNPNLRNSNAIVLLLKAGKYYLHISEVEISGNPFYRIANGTFTLNLIPDNAPDLVIVAASNSPEKESAHLIATGIHDEKIINLALNLGRKKNSAKILLRPGTYQIYDNIISTINNLIFTGTGWGTILKVADQAKLERAGVLRSRFYTNNENRASPFFSNQHFMHLVIDGNKSANHFFQNNVGNFGTYFESSFEDIRSHDFMRYGFDPHGTTFGPTSTIGLTIKECLADHNGQDGIVCDTCQRSLILDTIMDANSRHGLNIVTGSNDNLVLGNLISNNQATGITIQPGLRNLNRHSNNNYIANNKIYNNKLGGIYIYLSQYNKLIHNTIKFNQKYEIILKAGKNNLIKENFLHGRADNKNETIAIVIAGENDQGSMHNLILNNFIQGNRHDPYKFGISERGILEDYNLIAKNHLKNMSMAILLFGPHSQARDNTISGL